MSSSTTTYTKCRRVQARVEIALQGVVRLGTSMVDDFVVRGRAP